MEPLKITLRFSAPVLRDSEHPIHLDALIARALMLELEMAGSENAWRESDDLSSIFERTQVPNLDWVWKASMLMFRPALPKQWINQIRRSDPQTYFDDLGTYWVGGGKSNVLGVYDNTFRIDTASGHHRGYQWLAATQWMASAHAWAIADRDSLEHYLGKINHVGKKGANGFGLIAGFSIETAPSDEEDNWALRHLPAGMPGKAGVQYEPVVACLRAPYWKKLGRVEAREPIV